MKLKLERPLVFFDLETTGLSIANDRIVEISYYKVFPNGNAEGKTLRINPQIPIPPEATAVHGITNEDVKDCPTFKEVVNDIIEVLRDSDLAGYNSNYYDIPLLEEELLRAGAAIDLKRKQMVDVFTIFTRNEPRNLTAAYKFYCGKNLDDAHSAQADTMATYEVLMAQMDHYADLPDTVEGLAEYTRTRELTADFAGKIAYDAQGAEVFNFGKYKGMRVTDVFRRDPSYYAWLMGTDFTQYTKQIFTRIYSGK